jgi:uncharacterized protein (DUF934 family)
MSTIVRDAGFTSDEWTGGFLSWTSVEAGVTPAEIHGVDVPNTLTGEEVLVHAKHAGMLRISFPSSADGRGFTLARHLRLLGYTGRIRAEGHLISDQYAMARRSGFDEVEISEELAARQPEAEWQFRADWQAHDYQDRLRKSA